MSGEVGNHLSKRQNMSLDVVVFEKTKLPAAAINMNYATVPAKLIVEIDTEVELEQKIKTNTPKNMSIWKRNGSLILESSASFGFLRWLEKWWLPRQTKTGER